MASQGLGAPLRHALHFPKLTEAGLAIELDAQLARGLAFRQVNVKEGFTILDGAGRAYRASLKELTATGGQAVVYEACARSPESPLRLTLLCAVLSRQRMTTVVQKATELGVSAIVPVLTDHSVQARDLEHEKPWGWKGQVLRAVKQCRRASVPDLREVQTLAGYLKQLQERPPEALFLLDDRASPAAAAAQASLTEVVLAIGPEGGWSENERLQFARLGAKELALGGRVLRAETAVFVGLTVLQTRYGDLAPTGV
jgi:16S rRNA (uracil1498-N3)-methyltransferase